MNLRFLATVTLLVPFLLFAPTAALARNHRSAEAKREFQHLHPCPATGRRTGKCHGYIIDHRVALCVGGKDVAANMRWQTFDQSILKDRWECRRGWQSRLARCEREHCFVEPR